MIGLETRQKENKIAEILTEDDIKFDEKIAVRVEL